MPGAEGGSDDRQAQHLAKDQSLRGHSLCFFLRMSKMRTFLRCGVGCLREHFGGTFRSIVWQAEIGCPRFNKKLTEGSRACHRTRIRG